MDLHENYSIIFGSKRAVRLTEKEENELIDKIQKGKDRKAFEKLIRGNVGFIIQVVRQFHGRSLDVGDMIDEAIIGMHQAAKKFDATKNIRFISYAVWWIRQRIQEAVHINSNLVIVPQHKLKLVRQIKKLMNEGFTYSDVLSKFDNIKDIENLLRAVNPAVSLNHVESDETFSDDSLSESPKQLVQLEYKNLMKVIDDMNILSEKEQLIIKLTYGIDCQFEHNLTQIAAKLKISKERVRQIKNYALKKLRTKIMDNKAFYE